jgi:hypothetical protein
MFSVLFADVSSGVLGAMKFLAAVGGAVFGGLLAGFLASLICRIAANQRLPLWGRLVAGIGGAIIGALLVWQFWGGFGWGTGNGLGPGAGPGSGPAPGTSPGTAPTPGPATAPTSAPRSSEPVPLRPQLSRIEVLGEAPLQKIFPEPRDFQEAVKAHRLYRIGGRDGQVVTLEKLEDLIRAEQPPLKQIEIIVYQDSPSPTETVWVDRLRSFVRGLKPPIAVDVKTRDTPAPLP